MASHILTTPGLLIATSLGVGLSSFFGGANFALSYIAIPAVLLPAASSQHGAREASVPATPASHLALQWGRIFHVGKAVLPWFAVTSSICFTYVAWNLPAASGLGTERGRGLKNLKWVFGLAAFLAFSIGPFTLIVMKDTNAALLRAAGKAEAREEVEDKGAQPKSNEKLTVELFQQWGYLNLIRANLPLAAVLAVTVGLFLYA